MEEICLVLISHKHLQKFRGSDFREKIAAANAVEDLDLRWRNLPFVKWVRTKFAGIMTDGLEVEASIARKKDDGAGAVPPDAPAAEDKKEAPAKPREPQK